MKLIRGYWLEAARALKKALLGTTYERFNDRDFELAYESRKLEQEDDYPYLLELARGKHYIFDVGANVGRTALLMSTVLDAGSEVIAFEASELATRIMLENIQRNQLSNVISPINVMVSNVSGKTIDFFWEYSSGGASMVAGYLGHRYSIKKVTLALDDYVLQTGKAPDFVKIDVEGAEEQVLLGMMKILSDARPVLAVEIHSWATLPFVENAGRIFNIFKSVGYSMKDTQSGETITLETIQQWKDSRLFVVGTFENGLS